MKVLNTEIYYFTFVIVLILKNLIDLCNFDFMDMKYNIVID